MPQVLQPHEAVGLCIDAASLCRSGCRECRGHAPGDFERASGSLQRKVDVRGERRRATVHSGGVPAAASRQTPAWNPCSTCCAAAAGTCRSRSQRCSGRAAAARSASENNRRQEIRRMVARAQEGGNAQMWVNHCRFFDECWRSRDEQGGSPQS